MTEPRYGLDPASCVSIQAALDQREAELDGFLVQLGEDRVTFLLEMFSRAANDGKATEVLLTSPTELHPLLAALALIGLSNHILRQVNQ